MYEYLEKYVNLDTQSIVCNSFRSTFPLFGIKNDHANNFLLHLLSPSRKNRSPTVFSRGVNRTCIQISNRSKCKKSLKKHPLMILCYYLKKKYSIFNFEEVKTFITTILFLTRIKKYCGFQYFLAKQKLIHLIFNTLILKNYENQQTIYCT